MSSGKKDFYGKEVADAIQAACGDLGVSQENLDIEVIETGSSGIFGLIRKKAHIRASVQPRDGAEQVAGFSVDALFQTVQAKVAEKNKSPGVSELNAAGDVADPAPQKEETAADSGKTKEPIAVKRKSRKPAKPQKPEKQERGEAEGNQQSDEPISQESLDLVKVELETMVELMGFPSTVNIQAKGNAVSCTLEGEFETELIGPNGKVLDSILYLLRKIISRKVPERLRISLDAGNYRQRRLEELKVSAKELAEQVKVDGKTQALPALNPSERREIHMVLQEDKEIRSRSVGDGLFKKILIYKPGKNSRSGNRKQGRSRGPRSGSPEEKNGES